MWALLTVGLKPNQYYSPGYPSHSIKTAEWEYPVFLITVKKPVSLVSSGAGDGSTPSYPALGSSSPLSLP